MVSIETTHTAAQVAVQQADQMSNGAITLVTILLFLVLVMGVGFIYMIWNISRNVVHAVKTELASIRVSLKEIASEMKELGEKLTEHHGRLVKVETEMQHVERRRRGEH